MSKNMTCCVVAGLLVGAHTKDPPSDAEWSGMLRLVQESRLSHALFYTEGGSPSALQRKQLRELVASSATPHRGAILTDSLVARVAITAINLFTKKLSTPFPPTEIDAALDYLQTPKEQWPEVKKALFALKEELGLFHNQQ